MKESSRIKNSGSRAQSNIENMNWKGSGLKMFEKDRKLLRGKTTCIDIVQVIILPIKLQIVVTRRKRSKTNV